MDNGPLIRLEYQGRILPGRICIDAAVYSAKWEIDKKAQVACLEVLAFLSVNFCAFSAVIGPL